MGIRRHTKRIAAWIAKLPQMVESPDIWTNGIRIMGNEFAKNFDTEGAHLGHRWQGLTEFTKRTRADRGFSPAHPILEQSGSLRWMAAGMFQMWALGSMKWYNDAGQGYKGDGVTSLQVSQRAKELFIKMTGPKVQHMQKTFVQGERFGAGFQPSRPFWNLTDTIVNQMGQAITDRIMLDWSSAGDRAVLTGRRLRRFHQ